MSPEPDLKSRAAALDNPRVFDSLKPLRSDVIYFNLDFHYNKLKDASVKYVF